MASIHRSREIAADADALWARMRRFGDLDSWALDLGPMRLSGDETTPGTEREFGSAVGTGTAVERLLELDDEARSMRYLIVRSSHPVTDYVATLRVSPRGDGSLVEWLAEFEAESDDARQVQEGIGAAYDRWMAELARQTERPA